MSGLLKQDALADDYFAHNFGSSAARDVDSMQGTLPAQNAVPRNTHLSASDSNEQCAFAAAGRSLGANNANRDIEMAAAKGATQTTLSTSSATGTPAAAAANTNNARNRKKIAFYVSIVCIGFGISMFVNGIATKLLPTSDLVEAVICDAKAHAPSNSTITPHVATYILASMIDPIYMLAAGRAVALCFILLLLIFLERRKHARAGTVPPQEHITLQQMLLPITIGVTNVIAYACYMCLTSLAGVAVWSAMVGCYVVIPASYGILRRGESSSRKKVCGIIFCMTAAVLLGMAGSSKEEEEVEGNGAQAVVVEGSWWLKLLLYGGAILFWSFSDGISAYMLTPRSSDGKPTTPMSLKAITALTALGFGVSAGCTAGVSMLLHMYIRTPAQCAQPDTSSAAGGYFLMFFGQILGKVAWISVVILGSIGEASSFIPLIGLDVFIPAILGIMILHEMVGTLGYVGMALAAVGVTLIATAT